MRPETRAAVERLRTQHVSNYSWQSNLYRQCPVCVTASPCDVLDVLDALEAAEHETARLQRLVDALTATSPRRFKTGEAL